MLFSSFEFIFGFLPITLAGFYIIRRFWGGRLALGWLTAASLFFYGWWNPVYLLLLGGSIAFNFALGLRLSRPGTGRLLLAAGIAANLAPLVYFKYAGFLTDSLGRAIGAAPSIEEIVLPLAISFFTFQQIAYLVDAHKGRGSESNPLRYCLFISLFPQLIAGPIVLYREIGPQFKSAALGQFFSRNLAIGGTIFFLGLGKKILLADTLGGIVDPIFNSAAAGETVTFLAAWGGTLGFAFQIYFDFSAYSDMAIGLAFMFGIRLPINFNSPYKAGNVIEFWRRWHITLSRFLLAYLYIPLGGNRHGRARLYAALMTTMLLGGLWHGAGWTFVAWGGLHGIFLVVNRIWNEVGTRYPAIPALPRFTTHALTLFAVLVAWVFFRAEDFGAALQILAGMAGAAGIGSPHLSQHAVSSTAIIALSAFIALVLPDVQGIMGRASPAVARLPLYRGWLAKALYWRPTLRWSVPTAVTAAFAFAVMYIRVEPVEFIYFQF